MNDDYFDAQAVASGLKVANNTLKNEWRKTEKELKTNREARQNDLNLFSTILNKQKEFKILKDSAKSELEDKSLLKNLLDIQELLTSSQLTNSHERVINLITTQLTQNKEELAKKMTNEEIEKICQAKQELVKLELELESLSSVRLEAKIEVR